MPASAIARPTSSTAISTPSAASTSSVWRKSWNGAYSTAKISGPRADAKAGVEISLGHRFRWGDADWRALSVYACAKGLVLDLAKHVPAEDVRRFVEKWAPLEEAGLTPEQEEQALLESPFHDSFHAELLVNGRALRGEGSSGFAWRPDTEQDLAEQAVLAHYALDPAEHWQLWRLHFPWKRRTELAALTDAHRRSRLAARPAVHGTAGAKHVVHAPVDRNEPYAHGSGPRAGDAGRVRSAGRSGISCALFEAGVYRLAGAATGRAANSGRSAHRSAPAEDPGEQLRRSAGQRRGVHRIIGGEDGPTSFFVSAARRQTAGSPIPASISPRRNRSHGSCGFRSSRVGNFRKTSLISYLQFPENVLELLRHFNWEVYLWLSIPIPTFKNQVIYSVYVRAHTPEGHVPRGHPRSRPHQGSRHGHHLVPADPPDRREGQKRQPRLPVCQPATTVTVNPAYGTMDDFKGARG